MQEIESRIQSLNLLLATLKADRSGKSGTLDEYRKQYQDILAGKGKNGK